ncbi:ADP-ribosylglycohydrolase family protein, partial [Xanthomonas nasturtii]|nr:ADP-ribosylglycohydrolase family protein [Xanthomonas nasturtii]MCL1533801.1 ADP-ribosylglycohydrolase family protein [Xanthomonas nasturtii]MCL1543265.1 ADP-ribosylglycohydrolase family protein [Xanthomonas nasturtii]
MMPDAVGASKHYAAVAVGRLAGLCGGQVIASANLDRLEPVHNLLSNSAKKAKWMNCRLVLSL